MNLGTQLRAILLIVGVALLVGIYLLGRRKGAAGRVDKRDTYLTSEPSFNDEEFNEPSSDLDELAATMQDEIRDDSAAMPRETLPGFIAASTAPNTAIEVDEAIELPPMYADLPAATSESWREHTTQERQPPVHTAHSVAEPLVEDDRWTVTPLHPAEPQDATPSAQEPSLSVAAGGAKLFADEVSLHAADTRALDTHSEPLRDGTASGSTTIPTVDESLGIGSTPVRVAAKTSTRETPTLSDAVPTAAPSQRSKRADAHAADKVAPKSVSRKIIALRLAAGAERIGGSQLLSWLQDENLRHGKFNIFHRLHGSEAVFSVASMVEPGTFDVTGMAEQQFPGVTMFMLLPGPLDGLVAFDQMLSCAQRLVHSMHGVLQDERGIKLLPHGIERLREDVLDFQHLLGSADVSVS